MEITDSGVGIEPELLPRIFDAFEQGGRVVTNQYGGLGLGLAIAKSVVDLHGGTITARSSGKSQGATFTVTLKAMQTSFLDHTTHYLPGDHRLTQPASILLVEDHADTARVMQRMLEQAGYLVGYAGTVARARELAGATHFHLVISDLGLPDGNGVDLMQFLHTEYGLSGIALSGFGTEDNIQASSAAGFQEHITKPVSWPLLRRAIERLLANRPENAEVQTAAP